jgi:hypothetical protein
MIKQKCILEMHIKNGTRNSFYTVQIVKSANFNSHMTENRRCKSASKTFDMHLRTAHIWETS